MPLTRYQIRNEYSLADPELYKAADRDDPEALLEGVAMAGLVGVLRQLGDLAEFAAEIFHDLHEEVMATAARGHGLMARVQQLEAEFPSIEKAFLSQTNHTSFYSNAGVDWHPNLCTEQNLITRGDLPRCVMDSYEECRGPPRLFLLDKFDVAGAGACLKRYTDPSFFKVETGPSEPSIEVYREKKLRKVKKKGSRWKNGETPEIVPTSHAKLHQLFLEESVEKGLSDPARLVKLKKKQLDASPFDSRPGKSYMEKFLETPPERNEVREISVNPLPLKMASDYSGESGLEIYEITTVSPVKEKSQRKESTRSSPNAHEVVLKPSIVELFGNDRQIVEVPELGADGEREEIPPIHPKVMVERDIGVDGERKQEGSVDEDNSDDMTSEVDNYMDALTTVESEMETDHVYRPKSDCGFSNIEKRGVDPDRNGELLEFETHSSNSQSIGNFSASDDGNNSLKKGRSSFSYSDTLSNLAEIPPSDGEGSAKVFPTYEAFMPENTETQSNQLPEDVAVMCIDEDNINCLGEASGNSSLADSNHPLHPLDPGASSMQHHSDETPSESMKPGSALSYTDERETNLAESSAVVNDMPSQTRNGTPFTVSTESHSEDELDVGDHHVSFYVLSHLSNNSEVAPEDFAEKSYPDNTVNIKIGSPQSNTPRSNTSSPTEEQVHYSILSEVEGSDVGKRDDLVSEDVDALPETEVYGEGDTSQNCNFQEQHMSDIVDNVPKDELESVEETAVYSEEANTYYTADSEKIGASTCNVDAVDQEAVPRELPSNYRDCSILEDHAGLDDAVAEGVLVENMAVSATDVPAEASANDDVDVVYSLQDSICSPSNDTVNSGTEDPLKDGLEFHELVSHDCLTGPEAENETTQLQVAPKVFDSASCKLISHDESNSEMVNGVQNSSAKVNRNSLPAGDVSIPPTSSGLSDQELKSESLQQSHLLEGGANAMSLPAVHLPDPETSSDQPLELQTNQLHVECTEAEASPNSPDYLSEQIKPSIHTDQERLFNDITESCQENLPNEPSPCGYLQQSTGLEISITKQELDPLSSVLPSFGLLPEAAQVNLEEMPPLPPLPPMQWRLGKIQHSPLAPQREFMDHGQGSFPLILPFRDHEIAQSAFPAEQSDIQQSANPFLPVSVVEVEKPHVSEEVGDMMQPTLSSLQLPFMAEDENSPNSYALEGPQSLNPFITEKSDHGFLASEREVVPSSSNPFLSLPANEDTASEYDPVSSSEKLIHSLNQSASEPGLPHMLENFEGEHGNSSDKSVLPPRKVEDTASKNDPVPSPGKPIHLLNQSVSKPGLPYMSENFDGEHGNSFDTSVLPTRKVEDAASKNDPVPSPGKPIHLLNHSVSEPGLPHMSENFDGEHGNSFDKSVLPLGKVEDTASKNDPVPSPGKPIHLLNQSVSEPGLPHTSENFDGEHGNSFDKSVLPPRKVEDTASKNDPVPSPGKPIHLLNQSVSEPSLQHTSENFDGEHGNPFDKSVLPPRKVEDTASKNDPVPSPGKPIHLLNQSVSEPSLQHTSENFDGEHGNPFDKSVLPPRNVEDTASKNDPVPSPGKPIHLLNQSVSEPSLQHTSENLEREHGNPSDRCVLPPRNVEDAASNYDPVSSPEKPIHPLKQLASEPGLQQTSENLEEEHGNPSDTSVPPPRNREQPQHGLSRSEGESTWPSNPFALLTTSEVGHANGNSIVKLPRPRNPLIDAVAAHDKSKLRKVTERVRPQSEPKVDERNSLLEQIRTKSFNLKPAVVSRPSIQGPKTNLRVAAILEKANAIRQATAGSDEDDDEDWSDS